MSFDKGVSFIDILEKKIGLPDSPPANRAISTDFDMKFSSPLAHGNPIYFKKSLKAVYPYAKARKSTQKRTEAPKTKATIERFPILRLSESGQKHYFKLQALGCQFDDGFIDLGQLKAEYRRLARFWHPDTAKEQANPTQFANLTRRYRALKKELEALKD